MFTIEIVCTHCQDLYRLCSDCGGGGGRLTIGRWRCKELFPLGRRTCRLSHARNPRLHELQWTAYRTSEIPPERLSYIADGCRVQYFQSRLQTTARPEALEYGVASCRTYYQAAQLTMDSWNLVSSCLTENVEAWRGIRRYVAFQAAIPSSRRGKSKARTQTGQEDNPIINGFLFAEWDMLKGAVHYPAASPSAVTGNAFDAITRTGELAIHRIRENLARENVARAAAGVAHLPELKCVWLMSPLSKDSRAFASLRTRGYVDLSELRQDSQATEWTEWENSWAGMGGVFPPQREVHIPRPFTNAYQVVIRVFDGPNDLGGPPARRRPRKAGSQEISGLPTSSSRRK